MTCHCMVPVQYVVFACLMFWHVLKPAQLITAFLKLKLRYVISPTAPLVLNSRTSFVSVPAYVTEKKVKETLTWRKKKRWWLSAELFHTSDRAHYAWHLVRTESASCKQPIKNMRPRIVDAKFPVSSQSMYVNIAAASSRSKVCWHFCLPKDQRIWNTNKNEC